MENSRSFFQKLATVFLCLVLVVSISLPISVAYGDDAVCQLYAYQDISGSGYGVGSNDPVILGYVPSYSMPYIKIDYSVFPFPIAFQSSNYDPALLANKTVYIGWYCVYESNGTVSIPSSRLSISAYFNDNAVGSSNNWNTLDFTRVSNNVGNPYSMEFLPDYSSSSYKQTNIACCRFTLPDNSRSFRLNVSGYSASSGAISNLEFIVFPTLYVADWGSDIADGLDGILSELQTQTGSLNGILTVLGNIYTELQGIHTDSTTILSVLRSVLLELQEQTDLLTSIDGYAENISEHVENIDDYTQLIYSLLNDALASQAEDLDDTTESAMEQVQMRIDAEQYWNDSMTTNVEALDLSHFSFSSAVVNALSAVGGVFSLLWNGLGDFIIIPSFILILGISLAIIGRISRSSGKGGKDKSGKGSDG